MCLHRWFPQASDHNSPRDVCCTAGKQCDSELHCVQQQWFTNDHSLAEGWGGAVWCRSGKLCPVPRGRADLYHCASPPQCELHRWGALPVCGLQSLWFQLLQQGQAYCQWWGCVISLNECDQWLPVLFFFFFSFFYCLFFGRFLRLVHLPCLGFGLLVLPIHCNISACWYLYIVYLLSSIATHLTVQ